MTVLHTGAPERIEPHLESEEADETSSPAPATQRNMEFPNAELETLRAINARLLRDIEVLKQREAHALMLADRDGLTGLYNRRRMSELLEQTVAEASARDERFALLFIDLDGFKRINDHFGHSLGDELLTTVAGRVSTRARTGDIVCRFGGDEFVVILPRVPGRHAAEDIAAAIANLLSLPYKLSGEELRITAAVGLSMFPDDGRNPADLIRRADQLMYRAKAEQVTAESLSAVLTRRRDDRTKQDGGW